MRIDFSTIKEFRVPEGVVTQVADASGRVLWSAVKNYDITISCSYTHENAEPYVEVNGERYTVFGENVTLSVPLGTVITYGVNDISGHSYYNCYMYLNGTSVNADSRKNGVFSHTVNGNATIELINWGVAIGKVRVEAENVEMVTVTVNQINIDCAEAGIGLEGNTSSGVYEVPVGTEMSAWVCKDGSGSAKVILNGTTVYTTSSSGTYYHTITRNTIVAVDTVDDNGVITITET